MTVATDVVWQYVEGSGAQPYRNRGYYTRKYLLIGPTTREEAQTAVRQKRAESLPVETFHLSHQREDGAWIVDYSMDSTD